MRFTKATVAWLETNFPKLLSNVQAKNDEPAELVAQASLVEALRQECETSHTALADEKQKAENATAAAKEAAREAALPTSPAARNERARILGILDLERAKIPGSLTPSHKFDALLEGWAADPGVSLKEATTRFDDVWNAYDAAERERGLAALIGDEEKLDAPSPGGDWARAEDEAAQIRSAGDYAERVGALGRTPVVRTQNPDRLIDLVEEARSRIAAGERL